MQAYHNWRDYIHNYRPNYISLTSGYSKNLVRLFLEADGELTPAAIVADAISGPEYEALEVFD